MELHLAANYDPQLIESIAETSVSTVYGKLADDVVGGGRASNMGKSLSFSELTAYADKLRQNGLRFTYLLNSACLGNREWTRGGQRKIRKLLDKLVGAGIEAVTVSTPYLLKLIKKSYPELHVTVGIYAQVDTVNRVRFWESLGADAITLESFSINRDFERLKKIRAATDAELILIANHLCLPNCPLQPYHQNCFAHASTSNRDFFVDYCYLECNRRRFADPAKFISAGWIRPEDVETYAALGYDSFKLLERDLPSELLLKRVQAYEAGEFDGNLAELLLSHSFGRENGGPSKWQYLWNLLSAPLSSLFRADNFMRDQGLLHSLEECPVQIDAQQIPADFLDEFRSRDCANEACAECGYCADLAERAVTVTDPEAEQKYTDFIEQLESGDFWNV